MSAPFIVVVVVIVKVVVVVIVFRLFDLSHTNFIELPNNSSEISCKTILITL